MRRGLQRVAALAAAAAWSAGCGGPSERAAPPRSFAVGVHQVTLALPAELQHVDQGKRHLLRHGELKLVIEDLGPVGRRGLRREIERVRELWRRGLDREARTAMAMIPVPPEHFTSAEQRTGFWSAWHEVTSAPEGLAPAAAEPRFDRLLAAIDGLAERPVDAAIDDLLRRMGEDERRDVAWRRSRLLDGRPSWEVETWNRLSHDWPRRFAIVIDDGYALALHTGEVPYPEARPTLELLLRSLRIAPRAAQSTGERRSSA